MLPGKVTDHVAVCTKGPGTLIDVSPEKLVNETQSVPVP
jgi:hypothetical protein